MKRCFSSFCNVIISRDTQLKSLTIEIVVSRLHCIVCWFACLFEEKADRFFTPCPYIYILSVFFLLYLSKCSSIVAKTKKKHHMVSTVCLAFLWAATPSSTPTTASSSIMHLNDSGPIIYLKWCFFLFAHIEWQIIATVLIAWKRLGKTVPLINFLKLSQNLN